MRSACPGVPDKRYVLRLRQGGQGIFKVETIIGFTIVLARASLAFFIIKPVLPIQGPKTGIPDSFSRYYPPKFLSGTRLRKR